MHSWMGAFSNLRKNSGIPQMFVEWVKGLVKEKNQAIRDRRNKMEETIMCGEVSAVVVCGDVRQLPNLLPVPAQKGDHSNDIGALTTALGIVVLPSFCI